MHLVHSLILEQRSKQIFVGFAFVSISEPKKVVEAFMEPKWIQAMQEELQQFKTVLLRI